MEMSLNIWFQGVQHRFSVLVAPLRHQMGRKLYHFKYQQWVNALAQEAQQVAQQQPPQLTILLGDSLTQGFPIDLLLPNRSWLNQGIAGDKSIDLLRRLRILKGIKPDTIFLMIGINDLLYGESEKNILSNYCQIIRHLQISHPTTRIVVQSLLPHASTEANWKERDRLLTVSNQRILHLNQTLEAITYAAHVDYLDLYSLFTNKHGNLSMNLSTDGLHLNYKGYQVWQMGILSYL